VMGGSGCGKSTLLYHMIGLKEPASGPISYNGVSYWDAEPAKQAELMRGFGVLYQSGALWSSMTLAENVAFPLEEYTSLTRKQILEVVAFKLALVGLSGFEDFYPSQLSGGMQKRAGLARAMALDPQILFFDEPSAGLDPVSSQRLDQLIVELSANLGTTVVIVTHELSSIFAIATNSIMLDAGSKGIIARGAPRKLLDQTEDPRVISFLTRGGGRNSHPI